jgi:hypothetical protein
MSCAHLRDQAPRDIVSGECPALLRHDRVKQHLKQDVPELLEHVRVVP